MSDPNYPDSQPISPWQGWLKFTLVSLIFFHITAATFTSLGVVLPFMIEELSWSWSEAGMGFSVLAFMVGIASRIPSWTMRIIGTRATFGVGGGLMAIGFALLATSHGLPQYFIGTGLAGLGYTLCALVPGVAVINHWLPERRSFAIGAYMTIGGLGGVAGPIIVTTVVELTGSWRWHWWLMTTTIVLLTVSAIALLKSNPARSATEIESNPPLESNTANIYATKANWQFRNVVKTPQYYVIVAALTITLFGGLTTNSWAVTHMGNLGISFSVAAGALSVHALINALSRAFGGVLASWIDPKWLLAAALVAEIVGMAALAEADNITMIVLFAFGEGIGFGLCMFATTVLLVNYYGVKEAPKTMGTMYLISTIAMIGPTLSGSAADLFGSFAGVFQVYAAVLTVSLVTVVFMRPPKLDTE